jgi:hypothetical protein
VRYLVAVDDSKVKLKQITKAVAKKLGTGKFKQLTKEDALLNKEISVRKFAYDSYKLKKKLLILLFLSFKSKPTLT